MYFIIQFIFYLLNILNLFCSFSTTAMLCWGTLISLSSWQCFRKRCQVSAIKSLDIFEFVHVKVSVLVQESGEDKKGAKHKHSNIKKRWELILLWERLLLVICSRKEHNIWPERCYDALTDIRPHSTCKGLDMC